MNAREYLESREAEESVAVTKLSTAVGLVRQACTIIDALSDRADAAYLETTDDLDRKAFQECKQNLDDLCRQIRDGQKHFHGVIERVREIAAIDARVAAKFTAIDEKRAALTETPAPAEP